MQLAPPAAADEAPSVPTGGKRAARKRAAAEAAALATAEEPVQLPTAAIANESHSVPCGGKRAARKRAAAEAAAMAASAGAKDDKESSEFLEGQTPVSVVVEQLTFISDHQQPGQLTPRSAGSVATTVSTNSTTADEGLDSNRLY